MKHINLHSYFKELLITGKLHPKSAKYLSEIDVEGEQIWVMNVCEQYNTVPKIKQAKEIRDTYLENRLTVKKVREILGENIKPKKIVFDYNDISSFFPLNTSIGKMKTDVLKVLSYWKNQKA